MQSVELTEENLKKVDLVLLLTDHTSYDCAFIERHAQCIVDTRDTFRRNGVESEKIYKA